MKKFTVPAKAAARMIVAMTPAAAARAASSPERPRKRVMIVLATSPERAKRSPWAKLMSWRMP